MISNFNSLVLRLLQLHLFELLLDLLLLVSQVEQPLFFVLLDFLEVGQSLSLECKLLNDLVDIADSRCLLDFKHGLLVLLKPLCLLLLGLLCIAFGFS